MESHPDDVTSPPLISTASSARGDSTPRLYWSMRLQIANVACSQGAQSNHRCQGDGRRIWSHCRHHPRWRSSQPTVERSMGARRQQRWVEDRFTRSRTALLVRNRSGTTRMRRVRERGEYRFSFLMKYFKTCRDVWIYIKNKFFFRRSKRQCVFITV